jgi:outer membrane protein OmpA-like peptidoglycan-associated protein
MSFKKKEDFWIPYADLMTVLMAIFLFIAIAFMAEIQRQNKSKNKLIEDYQKSKKDIYDDLNTIFKNDFKRWNLELDKDLSIRFSDPKILFASQQEELPNKFKLILNDFFPKFLKVINNKKYRGKIQEVRIEGHTDDLPIVRNTVDPYIDNMTLSQTRARNVLFHFRRRPEYLRLSLEDRKYLSFVLTANGLSYGRTLDKNKKFSYQTSKTINRDFSRRVEFKIVTSSEQIIKDLASQIE